MGQHVRYLGVTFDKGLNWSKHIDQVERNWHRDWEHWDLS